MSDLIDFMKASDLNSLENVPRNNLLFNWKVRLYM